MSDEPIKALVVDDDPEIVEMVQRGLGAEGMRVLGASDGAEGLSVLSRERVDVVVLDIIMPKVDGWMMLMDIRNDPGLEDIPVSMLTQKNQDLARILAFKQGVQQYVTKPFNLTELAARVEGLANWHRKHATAHTPPEQDFRKIAVRKGGRTVLLAIEDIVFLSARNKSTYAHTFENQYLVDTSLGDLEDRLSREGFVRVHRSYVVNLDKIREILREEGAYVVVAGDRDETHIPVARRQVRTFREAVGI
ncbi:MAG: response regulator transcription factor [Coriobacteriales bacterium]|nr:response regulator transcription factor [Coriobacteriales bacterium]